NTLPLGSHEILVNPQFTNALSANFTVNPLSPCLGLGAYTTAPASQTGTTTTVTLSSLTAVFGEAVTITASVAVMNSGSNTPTGTVTFYLGAVGGTILGTGTLNSSGAASLTLSNLPVGPDSISASYGGDSNFLSSNSLTAANLVVNPASV